MRTHTKVKGEFLHRFVAKAPTFNEGVIAVILMVYNKNSRIREFTFRSVVVFRRILSKLLHDLA
jgi:hypothetical protein